MTTPRGGCSSRSSGSQPPRSLSTAALHWATPCEDSAVQLLGSCTFRGGHSWTIRSALSPFCSATGTAAADGASSPDACGMPPSECAQLARAIARIGCSAQAADHRLDGSRARTPLQQNVCRCQHERTESSPSTSCTRRRSRSSRVISGRVNSPDMSRRRGAAQQRGRRSAPTCQLFLFTARERRRRANAAGRMTCCGAGITAAGSLSKASWCTPQERRHRRLQSQASGAHPASETTEARSDLDRQTAPAGECIGEETQPNAERL